MARGEHEVDRLRPAVMVAFHRGHAGLEPVARKTVPGQNVFALSCRHQRFALIHGKVAPAHSALLEREIERGRIARGQFHIVARIGLVSGRGNTDVVVARRQISDSVAALVVGHDVHGNFGLHILGVNKRAAEWRAGWALYDA